MAKRARELAVKERRERKLAKKASRAHQVELATGSTIVAVAPPASADAGVTPTLALEDLRGPG
jgi:hypothetical protein